MSFAHLGGAGRRGASALDGGRQHRVAPLALARPYPSPGDEGGGILAGAVSAPRWQRLGGPGKAAALGVLAFAMLIVSLDQYIVVVALPEIGQGLDFSGQTLQTVISAYAVTSAGFLLLGGRAADPLGRRRGAA